MRDTLGKAPVRSQETSTPPTDDGRPRFYCKLVYNP